MPYNPEQPTPIDVIRGMARDTSGDPESEILQNEEYAAILGRFGVGIAPGTDTNTAAFYRAAAEALRQVAIAIEGDPSSVNFPQDMAASWSDRTRSLREQARLLEAKANDLDDASRGSFWGAPVTVRSSFLTGPGRETEPW